MRLAELDSRTSLGSDVDRMVSQTWCREYARPTLSEVSAFSAPWIDLREVRVIVARLGACSRVSAPALDIVVDAESFEQAWRYFLDRVSERDDSPWLAFTVGPTLREEIADGLDADPDEVWPELEAAEDD